MRVAIIGGGPSGLTAAKSCLEVDLMPTIFERDMSLGGLWKSGSGGRVWSSLKTNLSKHTCCFSDFGWPEDVPDFPSSSRFRQYIQDYATRFDLEQHVRFGHFVTAVTPTYPDGRVNSKAPMWSVTFTSTRDENLPTGDCGEGSQDGGCAIVKSCTGEGNVVHRTEIFDKCIIASGIFSEPNLPAASRVDGIAAAVEQGWATHGATYREPHSYAGKTALVVGCAFSGAEIASDLSGVTKRCLAATGHPSIFLPRLVAVGTSGGKAPAPASPTIISIIPSAETSSTVSGAEPSTEAIAETSGSFGSHSLSKSDAREHRSDQEGEICQRDGGLVEPNNFKVPLDLALYSLKSWTQGKTSTASALEKREGARKFLVQLAGRDPGDAHEALRLPDSGSDDHPQASSVRVVVSDEFLDKVQDGSIEIRSRLTALDLKEKTARFSDGTCTSVDHVIFCTGLRPRLSFLPEELLRLLEFDENDLLQPLILHLQTWNPRVPGLGFVGVYRGPYFGSMELQARWLTRMWAGVVLPPTEAASIGALEEARSVRSSTPRPQFPTDYVDLMEGLASVAGLLPSKQHMQAEDRWEGLPTEGSMDCSGDRISGSAVPPSSGGTDHVTSLPSDLAEATASGLRTNALDSVVASNCLTEASDADDATVDAVQNARTMMRALGRLIRAEVAPGQQDEDDRAQEEKAMRLLKEWMWSGPFLPCHYHVRQFLPLDGGSRDAIIMSQSSPGEAPNAARPRLCGSVEDTLDVVYQAIAEIQYVNEKLEKAHRAFS